MEKSSFSNTSKICLDALIGKVRFLYEIDVPFIALLFSVTYKMFWASQSDEVMH